MVDSVSGNAAAGSARQAVQLANGRERAEAPPARIEQPRATDPRSVEARSAEAKSVGQVSAARSAIREMAAEPPVDGARVADLRAAISSGSYRVDADRIADAMLRSETGVSSR
jgi:negative regulator of flagellin synthesis FlgM